MRSLAALAADAADCRACDLWAPATQVVFGEGPRDATMVLVGEQPGDREDVAGRPFVGPAGRVLDDALAAAGIDRSTLYLTNAVKHFKFVERGNRRIHQKPNATEIVACHRWIEGELAALSPRVVVLMGAVAVRSVLGRPATISSLRGATLDVAGGRGVVTLHPSAILRANEARELRFADLVADLTRAGDLARRAGRGDRG